MPNLLPTQRRSRTSVIVVLMLAAALLLSVAPSVAAFSGCSAEDAPAVNADFEARVAELVNAERAAQGLPPLKLAASLSAAARYHATDLGSDNYFKHDSHDRVGSSLTKVCGTFDRLSLWYDWTAAAENIGGGYGTPEDVVAGWMDSAGHRGNILSTDFQELGVGYFAGAGELGSYWVQDFGTQSGTVPLILANEAIATAGRDLNVYVYGDWQEMRLRNDGDGWSDWMPFSNSFTWKIGSGAGRHVVEAELRNSGGAVVSTCDAILLDPVVQSAPARGAFNLFLPAIQSTSSSPAACE